MTTRSSERIRLEVPSDLRYGEATRAMLDMLSRRLEQETETVGLNTQVISSFNEAFNNVSEVSLLVEPCEQVSLLVRGYCHGEV